MHLNLVIHNPIVIHFSQELQHFVVAFSSFIGIVALFRLFIWLFINLMNAEIDTCLQPYNPFHFSIIGTRANANIHKMFVCKYL